MDGAEYRAFLEELLETAKDLSMKWRLTKQQGKNPKHKPELQVRITREWLRLNMSIQSHWVFAVL